MLVQIVIAKGSHQVATLTDNHEPGNSHDVL